MKRKHGMGRVQRRWWEEGLYRRDPGGPWSVKSVRFTKRRSRRRQRRLGKAEAREVVDRKFGH